MPKHKVQFEVSENNGVIAVRPAEDGEFKELVCRTKDGTQRVWVFMDDSPWTDGDGNERFDHHRRGIRCGTLGDFRHWEEELWENFYFRTGYGGFFVPCSNGEQRRGQSSKGPVADFTDEELKMVRVDDFPSMVDLTTIIDRQEEDRQREREATLAQQS